MSEIDDEERGAGGPANNVMAGGGRYNGRVEVGESSFHGGDQIQRPACAAVPRPVPAPAVDLPFGSTNREEHAAISRQRWACDDRSRGIDSDYRYQQQQHSSDLTHQDPLSPSSSLSLRHGDGRGALGQSQDQGQGPEGPRRGSGHAGERFESFQNVAMDRQHPCQDQHLDHSHLTQSPSQPSTPSHWRFVDPSVHQTQQQDWRQQKIQSPVESATTSPFGPSQSLWRAESGARSPSSPFAPRRPRDAYNGQQNSDPLVYHDLISDPVTDPRTHFEPSQPQTRSPQAPAQEARARVRTRTRAHTELPPQSHSGASFSPFSPTRPVHRPFASSPPRTVPTAYYHHSEHGQPYALADEQDTAPSGFINKANPIVDSASSPRLDGYLRYNQPRQPPDSRPSDGPRVNQQLLPVTPVSPTGAGPRWESLPPNSRKLHIHVQEEAPPVAGLATTTDAYVTFDSSYPPSPLRSPRSPTFATNLYCQPLIPEDDALDLQPYDTAEATRYEQADPVTTAGQLANMYRPDSRQSEDTAYSADNYNFSRPRKPSLRSLNRPEFPGNMPFRPGTAKSTQSDSLRLDSRTMASNYNAQSQPFRPYSPAPRRQPSVASNMSTSTYVSTTAPSMHLQHRPSHDHMGIGGPGQRNMSQTAAAGNFMGLPHTAHPQVPPRYYNRAGPLPQNQQSHLYEDEIRASVRSHLTTSTAQETLFTEPERSSYMTKTSSVFSAGFRNTRQSSFFGPHNISLEVRDSLSVDDVMGMYEHGFNDSEMDLARRMSGIDEKMDIPVVMLPSNDMDDHEDHEDHDHDDSRPASAMSHRSEAASRLLEAMNQSNPMPIPGRSFPLNGDSPVVLRDTNAFFRKSLASSLPKDMRLSFISTRSKMSDKDYEAGTIDGDAMNGSGDADAVGHIRHDSGKMVDPRVEEFSPIGDSEQSDELDSTLEAPLPVAHDRLSPKLAMSVPNPSPSPPLQGAAQPEDLDPDANDRYGFRKSNQYITREQYDEWNGQYSEYLARRRKKWEAFLKENGLMTDRPNRFPQHSAKAKRFVRKGIPPDWRGAAWFYYAGGPKILANNRGVYNDMVKRAANGQLKEVCRDDIERDLYRTFPDNIRFRRKATATASDHGTSPELTPVHSRNNSTQSANPQPRAPGSEPEIIDQLRRVLSAFAVFNPSIGYCQSLNFLGGMLLLFVESEEQAFWLLNIITRVYLPGTHEMSLEGSKVDLSVLMAELQEVLPTVWLKISDDGSSTIKKKPRRHRHQKGAPSSAENLPPVTLALTAWFMSCFIGTLPIETTLRVWDVFFYEGSKTLFRVALAIFKAGESEIKAINDPMEVFAVVQSLPRRMLDANALMDICFKRRSGLNHITSEAIDERRAERKERLHSERKEAVAAATNNPGIQPAATIAVSRTKTQATDMMSVNSGDSSVRRRHNFFGRKNHYKDRGLAEV